MNKDSWNIIFNKANDITLLSTKELRERRNQMDEEITRRRRDKYRDFLDSIESQVKYLFIRNISIDTLRAFEEETQYPKRNFCCEDTEESDSNEIQIDIEGCKVKFYTYGVEEVSCTASDCQKIIDFLVWVEDN